MDWWIALWRWVCSVPGGFINWWNTLNIGNLSEAFAAIGTTGAVVVTLWQVHREAERHRQQEGVDAKRITELEDREDARIAKLEARERRSKIAGVTLSLGGPLPRATDSLGNPMPHNPIRVATLYNDSPVPIKNVAFYDCTGAQVEAVDVVRPGATAVAKIDQDKVGPEEWVDATFFDPDNNEWLVDSWGNWHEGESKEFANRFTPRVGKKVPQAQALAFTAPDGA